MKHLKLFFLLVLIISLSACGVSGSRTPVSGISDVTGTKDDPSIQAVKALFSTIVNDSSVGVDSLDQSWPFFANLIGTGDFAFPCSTGTRSCTGFQGDYACAFTNCEFEMATITHILDSTPTCLSKVTMNGNIDTTVLSQTDNLNWVGKCTNTVTLSFDRTDNVVVAPISCAFDVTFYVVNGAFSFSGTVCGVDINTVDSVCSL